MNSLVYLALWLMAGQQKQPPKTEWPQLVGTAQLVFTQAQKEAFPANAWMKPCGPSNHDDACYTPDPPGTHKFYITGYGPHEQGGDCRFPAIVARGTDRVDALSHTSISLSAHGITVWTEQEYADMRKSTGEQFDKDCAKYVALITPVPEPNTQH